VDNNVDDRSQLDVSNLETDPNEEAAIREWEQDQLLKENELASQSLLPGFKLITFISSSAGRDKKTGKSIPRKDKRRVRLIEVGQGTFKFLNEGKDNVTGIDSLAEEIFEKNGGTEGGNALDLVNSLFEKMEKLGQK